MLFATLSVVGFGVQDPNRPADVVKDYPYVRAGHAEQRLDFYWARGATATVLFVHGGSLFESGERRTAASYLRVCEPIVAAGLACATIDYRLAPSFKWPAMPRDVVSAIAAVRELVRARGGEPQRLFLFGHSSGCQLVAVVGLDATHLAAAGLAPRNIAGVVPMGCVLDRWDAAFRGATAEQLHPRFAGDSQEMARYESAADLRSANPSFHVGRHAPPMLVIVAEEERFMPAVLEQGSRFVRRLRELQRPADIAIVPGTHMSSIEGLVRPESEVLRRLLAFVRDPVGSMTR